MGRVITGPHQGNRRLFYAKGFRDQVNKVIFAEFLHFPGVKSLTSRPHFGAHRGWSVDGLVITRSASRSHRWQAGGHKNK